MIILLYVEPGFFIHTNDDEFINSKKSNSIFSSFKKFLVTVKQLLPYIAITSSKLCAATPFSAPADYDSFL